MKKEFLFIAFLSLAISPVLAGGLLTNTNQSAHFLRNPALDATTEIDGVYTNPAGLTFLSDGFHLSLTNQSVYQTRTISSTFAPFAAYNGGDKTKIFVGNASVPIVPSFQFAYKKDRYALSAGFAITGGGGKAVFNQGLPSFEAPISTIPLSLTSKGVKTSDYSVDSYMEGKQFIFGFQINGSFQITKALSGALGLRLNGVSNSYVGHLKDIQINPQHPVLNPSAGIMSANTFFTNAATSAIGASNSLAPIVAAGYGLTTMSSLVSAGVITANQLAQLSAGLGANVSSLPASQVQSLYNTAAATYAAGAKGTADKQLDCTQSGWGVTPIISFNYHLDGLNLALKYEFKSSLNVENNTVVDDTHLYPNGVNTPQDIPALLTFGAEYEVCKKWKVSGGYHHFFDSEAKMANNKEKYIKGGVNEYLFGSEYKINDMFLISAGGQITRTGVEDAYQTDMSYSLNSHSIGFGGAINITPNLRLNLSYFFTNYDKWTKETANYNNTNMTSDPAKNISGVDVYDRTNKVFGVGVEYKF